MMGKLTFIPSVDLVVTNGGGSVVNRTLAINFTRHF